jgi:hypothetical protein
MEALLVREGNHHTYKSPTLTLSSSIDQIAKISTLQVDGFSTTVSLVIKYKKGTSNKVVDMLFRPPIVASIILKNAYLSHDSYIEQYVMDEDFKEVYTKLTLGA